MATMQEIRFGIEIEVVAIGREQIAQAVSAAISGSSVRAPRYDEYEVKMADGRRWTIVRDGSLPMTSGEIVSPILHWADMGMLQSIVRSVRAAGGRVDSSCGIHIHVDGAALTARGVVNLAKMMNKQEDLICKALKVDASRRSRYCRPLDAAFISRLEERSVRTIDDVSTAWYGYRGAAATRYDNTRYHALNLNSLFYRGTVEFRLFNGTLHAGEIKAYVHLCLAMAAKASVSKSAVSKKRETSDATAKYDMRVFLLGLGFIGDEFETTRLHLLKHLSGSAAFRGRPTTRRSAGAVDQEAA